MLSMFKCIKYLGEKKRKKCDLLSYVGFPEIP